MVKRVISALAWVAVTAAILALILGVCYGALINHHHHRSAQFGKFQ